MNTANNMCELELHPSPVKSSDENPVLSDILIMTLQKTQLSHTQIRDSQVLWYKFWIF